MWYVIWTLSRNENELLDKIKKDIPDDLYVRAWIPQRIEKRKIRGEERNVLMKLFPGYVFIETDSPDKIHLLLRYEKEYIKLLKTDDEFAPVSEYEEKIIKRLTGEEGVAGMSLGIIENGKLRVISGPLTNMEKYIVKTDRHKKKASLEIKMFGRTHKFIMGLEIIKKS